MVLVFCRFLCFWWDYSCIGSTWIASAAWACGFPFCAGFFFPSKKVFASMLISLLILMLASMFCAIQISPESLMLFEWELQISTDQGFCIYCTFFLNYPIRILWRFSGNSLVRKLHLSRRYVFFSGLSEWFLEFLAKPFDTAPDACLLSDKRPPNCYSKLYIRDDFWGAVCPERHSVRFGNYNITSSKKHK